MLGLFKKSLAMAVALGISTAAAWADDPIVLRFQHFVSPKSAVPARFMVPWAEKVMAESNGRLKIELYPGMQLGGKPPALYDQIRDGVIDGGWALPAYTPGRFPETEALELPFISVRSAEAASKAAWEYSQKWLIDGRFKDIKVIAVHMHGPGMIHKKGPPVKSAADFKGLKLRGPSRAANAVLEAMGATPVGMPVPAFPEALSKGVVDGGVIPNEIVVPLKVHELADSHTDVGGDRDLYNTFFIWGMNRASYDRLPDDLKAVIDANSGLETSAWAGRAMDEGDAASLKIMHTTDNTFYTMDADARAEIEAIGQTVVDTWVADVTAKGLDGQAMIDDARALMAKYE